MVYGPLQPSSRRSGIALIMVLGILSVMVIMAVAFAISMRTERVAAGNYADSVRARQLVQVGLARAMDDLAGQLGTNGLMTAGGGTNYPPWDVTNSYAIYYTNSSTNVNVLRLLALNRENEATNFVPRALWTAATNADYTKPSNHWLPLDSIISNNGVVAESNRVGRVKYLILNCSGLLDANWAGKIPQARGAGTNPNEIVINNLPEMADAVFFITNRNDGKIRYETLEELNELNTFAFNGLSSNFIVYSYSPMGFWDVAISPPCIATQVNLSGSSDDLKNRYQEITNALSHANFSSTDANVIFSNLLDYVDADSIPTNSQGCGVEAVPMISEICVSNIIISAGAEFQSQCSVFVEWWYPFVNTNAASYQVQVTAAFETINGNDTLRPGVLSGVRSAAFTLLATNIGFVQFSVSSGKTAGNTIEFRTTISAQMLFNGTVIDDVSVVLTNDCTVASPSMAWRQCDDPRFNNDPNQWTSDPTHNLGVINLMSFAHSGGDTTMYVANQPLQSVGELGAIAYAPWTTIQLYGVDCKKVLDKFVIADEQFAVSAFNQCVLTGISSRGTRLSMNLLGLPVTLASTGILPSGLVSNQVYYVIPISDRHFYLASTSNGIPITISSPGSGVHTIMPTYVLPESSRKGRVNFNTKKAADALTAVFNGMPRDRYAGDPNAPAAPLSISDARSAAQSIISGGYYTNLSDLGRSLIPVGSTKLERDSYFRNTCGLLSVRQNLFTIIIEAQVASGGNIPRNPVRQRAVALVWRDPYTGEMFVRSLKWLKD